MKVRVLHSDKIVEAKRFKDFTHGEAENETGFPGMWNGDEIFIRRERRAGDGSYYLYMCDEEVEVIEESGGNE